MTNRQFRRFYDDNYGLVYFWLLSKLRNRDMALDVASQTFLKAWARRRTLCDRSKSHAWIMTIAHNEMVRHWQDSNRRRQESIECAYEIPDPRDFIKELETYEECQRVMNAALCLRSVSRRAILKAIKEIPQQGTAGSRLFKARQELKELCAA